MANSTTKDAFLATDKFVPYVSPSNDIKFKITYEDSGAKISNSFYMSSET